MGTEAFQTILPDHNNDINYSGQVEGSTTGPGYKSVKLSSKSQTMKNRTNSGRLITRSHGSHTWDINITYNPMTRAEFEPIYNFLLGKRGGLDPFYVSLPQYKTPQDSNFADYTHVNAMTFEADVAAGATSSLITKASYTFGGEGQPRPGDMFTITDTGDTNHTKAYRITKVENRDDYVSSQPDADQLRIHFVPGLAKSVESTTSTIKFSNPLIRVVLSNDVQEYSLGVDGLYQFSLKLEEAQP